MIELPVLGEKEIEWYKQEVRTLFVRQDCNQDNFLNYYTERIKFINVELEKLDIDTELTDRSDGMLFEKLIVAPFSDLKKIKEKISDRKDEIFYFKEDTNVAMKPVWENLKKKYTLFVNRKQHINLIKKYKIKSCPYCNENYITNRGEKHATAQLDHFYPKDQYPIFALCLYNLVPSCSSCNHTKGSKLIGVSPHDHSYDYNDLKITYKPKTANWINNADDLEVCFTYKSNNVDFKNKMDCNLKELKIREAYEFHKDYLQEILKKASIYSPVMRDEIKRNFPQLFSSDEEIIQILFGNYIVENDLLQRPLSKMLSDILKELMIY